MDSFVCKIVILRTDDRKVLKPKNFLRPPKATSIKKCLFGVASQEDTDKMVQEQYEIDRKRFMDRFGIDLKSLEATEREDNSENLVSQVRKVSVINRKVNKRSRDVFKPHNNQTVMTDFYQARKTVQSTDKSSKETKEN